jgi:hypothetical protein
VADESVNGSLEGFFKSGAKARKLEMGAAA